jgi:hypothetical protein
MIYQKAALPQLGVQSSKFKPLPGKWLLISHANK